MKKLISVSIIFALSALISLSGIQLRTSQKAYALKTSGASYTSPQIANGISIKASISSPGSDEFFINIPKINVSKKVIPNVDPVSKENYLPILDNYVAHGRYTRLPDQAEAQGNVYLFAHRQGQSAFFARLDELQTGDRIEVNYDGRIYSYSVYDKFVVDAKDTWVYTGESQLPTLTLQTCENGTAQRLIIKAKLLAIQTV